MSFIVPTISDFKINFHRDFPFGNDPNIAILDVDISKAISYAAINFNEDFFSDQASYSQGYMLLTAHFLVMNMRASSQGINGQFNFLQAGKGVGSVSESFSIPQRILDNPELSILTKTNYGAMYLQLILPQLCGQMFSVCGWTHP